MAKLFHVFIAEEGHPFQHEEYETKDEVKNRFEALLSERGKLRQYFIVHGERWNLAAGNHGLFYLIPPHGLKTNNTIPLFELAPPNEVDPEGWIDSAVEPEPEYTELTSQLAAEHPKVPDPTEMLEEDPDDPFSDD